MASSILQTLGVKERACLIGYWVEVLDHLFMLNNFQSLMPIYCGLTIHPVHKLKNTWTSISKQSKQKLEKVDNKDFVHKFIL